MKQYIKNIMILILALPWGLLLTNCSDSEPIIRTTTRIRHLL